MARYDEDLTAVLGEDADDILADAFSLALDNDGRTGCTINVSIV